MPPKPRFNASLCVISPLEVLSSKTVLPNDFSIMFNADSFIKKSLEGVLISLTPLKNVEFL